MIFPDYTPYKGGENLFAPGRHISVKGACEAAPSDLVYSVGILTRGLNLQSREIKSSFSLKEINPVYNKGNYNPYLYHGACSVRWLREGRELS